jgi:multiple sugar transport system substrate-binding protein
MMQAAGAKWFDKNGKAILANDPRWAKFLTWDRNLIDWYGADNLQRFVAGKGQEFSSANDFERGRVAMLYDGEWRNAFIKSDKSPVKYMTAPFPYLNGSPGQAGSGVVGGNIVAIPKGAKHPAEAWLLIKYLATDTNTLVGLSNRLQNLPTTTASLNSPKLVSTPQFATFEKIFQNKASTFPPVTSSGQTYQDLWNAFFKRWEAGKIKASDLHSSLASLDTQIDDQLAQQAAP